MESNDLLIERIRGVNPVPNDDETMPSTEALLAAVDERSGVMQTETVRTEPVKPPVKKRRKGLLVAAAAFAVVLGVVGVFALLASSEDPGPAETPPVTTAAPTPTTAVSAPTTLDPEAAWEAIPTDPEGGRGRVRTTAFAVPFSNEVGFLELLFEQEDWLAINHAFGVNGGIDITLGLDTVEATVAALAAIHDLYPDARMTDPVPATVGGAHGVGFESVGLPAFLPEGADHPFIVSMDDGSDTWTVGSFGFGSDDSGSGEIFVVDVDGQIVVIGFGASEDCIFCPSPPTPAQVEAAKARLGALIESIEWKDLG